MLNFVNGSRQYVLQELLEKYPRSEIINTANEKIVFNCDIEDIDEFRNLYSPTHITDSNGKILNLSRRCWRKAYIPAGINPSLAYVLCMIGELDKEDIVYDPFCGSSTIPITALKYFGVKKVLASDLSENAIKASRLNFLSANIPDEKYSLFRSDVSKVYLNKQNIDKIISNLPFGIRVGSHQHNIFVYSSLEKLADKLLRRKGKIVILSQEKILVKNTFRNWDVKSVARVNEGGLLPEIFVIERKS